MLTITDIGGNTEALTGYQGLRRSRNLNGEKVLSLIVLPTPQNAHSFEMVSEESIVEFGGEPYRIKQLAEKSKGPTHYKEVIAVHTFFDLIDEHVYALHNGSMTFANAVEFVLGGTEYTWAIVDTFYAQDFENFGDENRLALFQTLLVRYGAEFTLTGTHITFKKRIGNATDFQFRYSYNIKTITRDIKTSNLSTYIKGFGKKNDDGTYVVESEYTSPNASVFGIRHAQPVRDERYTTLEGLNDRLQAELNDEPEVTITLDFADLRRAGFPYDVPSEGDDVFLIYEPIGIDVETQLMAIDEDFAEGSDLPIKTVVMLGNIRDSIVDRWANVEKQVNDIIGSDGKVKYNVLDAAVKRATEALRSAQTELEFDNGIIARSKDNPNHLTIYNSAGLGISLDGGTTFEEAITYLGINTKLLTAGDIHTNNIKIIGEDNFFFWDGNALQAINPNDITKYVKLTSGELYIAKGAVKIERPDGYVSVSNGIVQGDFAIIGSSPPFQEAGSTVTKKGIWWASASEGPESLDYFTFFHNSRYLKILVAALSGTYDSTAVGTNFSIYANDGTTVLASKVTYETNPASNIATFGEILTIDLGVPTGQVKSVYAKLNSGRGGVDAYARIIYMWKEG